MGLVVGMEEIRVRGAHPARLWSGSVWVWALPQASGISLCRPGWKCRPRKKRVSRPLVFHMVLAGEVEAEGWLLWHLPPG